jgi:hypothetical protein
MGNKKWIECGPGKSAHEAFYKEWEKRGRPPVQIRTVDRDENGIWVDWDISDPNGFTTGSRYRFADEKPQTDIEKTLAQRGERYGKFSSHAEISQGIKEAMGAPGWGKLSFSQREALEMIAHKIGRIINGDPLYVDNFRDIIGYAQLVVDELMVTPGASDSRVETVYFSGSGWSK